MTKLKSIDIYNKIRSVVDDNDKVIVIHSSLFKFRTTEEQLKWPLLNALQSLVHDGYTIAIPAFTFSFTKNKHFDITKNTSEVGILAEWVQDLIAAKRTTHPIYSFIVLGDLSEKIITCKNTTTFGNDSCFAYFEQINARIIMFGCSWKFCTQFHFYEEESKVPYREYKEFSGKLYSNDKYVKDVSASMYVRKLNCCPVNDFTEIESDLNNKELISKTNILDVGIESTDCLSIGQICRKHLAENIFSLINNENRVQFDLSKEQDKANLPILKIAVLSLVNSSSLCGKFKEYLSLHLPERINIYSPEYGQTYKDILDVNSMLYELDVKFSYFIDRIEDIFKVDNIVDIISGDYSLVITYVEIIKIYAERNRGYIFINNFASLSDKLSNLLRTTKFTESEKVLHDCNEILYKNLSGFNNITILDMTKIALSYGDKKYHDPRLWFIAKIPYSNLFANHLIDKYTSLILSHTGKSIRVLAIDLDNTLWGGVLGEDGKDALLIGGDYPGNVYRNFQKTLLTLSKNHGIALIILSKNDEQEALDAMNSLPSMLINEDKIISHAINWNEKWENLRLLSKQIGVGLENIGFIDDNPVERESIKNHLPEVKVIDLPIDPAFYSNALLSNVYMSASLYSDEKDSNRSNRYKIRKEIENKRGRFDSVESFYKSLGMSIVVNELDENNIARAVQLINKTNQFNTTALRYTHKEIEALSNTKGKNVFVIGMQDKYSEYENIGIVVCSQDEKQNRILEIELLLLSCRVLGRGIDTSILYWLTIWAENNSIETIAGEIIETKRNLPVRDVYANHGFSSVDENRWVYDIENQKMKSPTWVKLIDRTLEQCGE